jgi:hypothetical protein
MPPPRAASPRDVQRQRDEDTVRAHVRRSLVGLTPADTRATPENLERLARNVVEGAARDLPRVEEAVLRRVLTEELLLHRDNAAAERRADDARAGLREAQQRLQSMAPPLSVRERDPGARAKLSPIKSRRSRPRSRGAAAAGGLGDISVIDAFPTPLDVEGEPQAAPNVRVRRRYFLRGMEDSSGEFPRHGHFDCTLEHEDQLAGPEQYIHDRFKVSFVDSLDSAHKLSEPPRTTHSTGGDGSSTLTVDPLVLGRWLSSTAPYSRSDAPPLFILCRDILRHLLKDRLALVSAEAGRLAEDLQTSRAETAAERVETEKVREMLSKKLRRLEDRLEPKQQQIEKLNAEVQRLKERLKERSDELVDAQAELFMAEALPLTLSGDQAGGAAGSKLQTLNRLLGTVQAVLAAKPPALDSSQVEAGETNRLSTLLNDPAAAIMPFAVLMESLNSTPQEKWRILNAIAPSLLVGGGGDSNDSLLARSDVADGNVDRANNGSGLDQLPDDLAHVVANLSPDAQRRMQRLLQVAQQQQ